MARGLDRFTADQRRFLETYLKGGIFNRKSDKKTADGFKSFLDAEKSVTDALTDLAGRSGQEDAINARLTAARALKDDGKFDEATAEANRALELAGQAQDAVHLRDREALRLRGVEAGKTVPNGANADETTDINDRKTAIQAALAGNPPTQTELDTAAQGLRDLETALETIKQAIAARAKERADLTTAHADFTKRIGEINGYLARATSDSEHGTLSGTATTIQPDIDALKTALDGTDHGAIQTELGNVAGIGTALDSLAADVDAALARVLKATMDGTGTTDAQKDQLAALGKADPAALAAAVKALKLIELPLGDVQIDQADLLQRAADTAAAEAEVKTKADTLEAAAEARNDAYEIGKAALDAKNAAMEAEQTAYDTVMAYYTAHKDALDNSGHPDHAKGVKAYQKLVEAFKTVEADRIAKDADFDTKLATFEAAKKDENKAKAELATAETDLADRKSEEKAATGKKKLLDAIAFGPLNPDHAHSLKPPAAEQLAGLFAKEPGLADRAVMVAAKAKNPESVALAAVACGDRAANGFASDSGTHFTDPDYPYTYSENLIDMAANIPPAEAAKLDAYLADGRQFADVPGVKPIKNRQKTGKVRADFVGEQMLNANGTMDFAKGRDAMLDVMFHPDSLGYPTSMQAMHMLDTLDFLEGSTDAQDVLRTTPDPTEQGAKDLLAGITGKNADAVDATDARGAMLTAMLTPMYQGNVGSCFTTGGVIKQQQERPLEMLNDLRKMATEGIFEPRSGDPVPVVQSVSDDENGLLRSFEYTTATATARVAGSTERGKLETSLGRAVDYLSDDFKSKRRDAIKAALKTAMSDAFDFVYDPTVSSTGSDGNSTHGSFMLLRKQDGAVIDSHQKFSDTLEDVILATLEKKDTKFRVSRQDVADWTRVPEFLDKVRVNGKLPWELSSGGWEYQAAEVLEGGGTKKNDDLSPAADASTMDVAQRTKDVVGDLLGRFQGSADKNVSVATEGKFNHAFNFQPDHPSMAPFKGGTPDEIKDRVQTQMIDKAAAAAAADMPLDKVTYLFDRAMEALAKNAKGPAKAALDTAWTNNRPTAPMTPAVFAAHVQAATDAWAAEKAIAEADAWRQRKIDKGDTVDPGDYDNYKDAREEAAKRSRDTAMSNRLRDDLALPEIVLADTNWGDPQGRRYFVLAPDPLTGTPRMYLKSDPPGSLSELKDGDEWLASYWCTTI